MTTPEAPLPPSPKGGPGRHPVPPWTRTLARWLDDVIRVPGTNIGVGLDAILGFFLPGVGDTLTAVTSLSIVMLAIRQRVPRVILARMVLNVAVDAAIGALPVIGDLFDVAFRASRKNLALLERHGGAARVQPNAADYALVGLAGVLALCSILLPLFLAGWLLSRFG